jgi:predicted dehydrogenase
VIATPTESHSAIALPLIESGVHTLIEKPMPQTLAEADAADRRGQEVRARAGGRPQRALQSGGRRGRPYVNDPRFIEVHRLGTQLGRSLDIDVVLDLMIHDLDLI